jgi:crotonobetainyl-CoA:carnitine CoA-transferase CaiB-like acyl-CoA transferase
MHFSTSAIRSSKVNKRQINRSSPEASQVDAHRAGPLAEIRVIDLTHMLAGPYCTWLLGALGAQITKVEMPGRGDFTRGVAPLVHDQSVYFMSVNRNKRSITLNLKDPAGRAALLRLVERSDIFVENNRPGAMARLKLDYRSIAKVNPRIIYASISGFGQTGPYSQRPAFDAVIQAMSGMMSLTGEEDGPPARVGMSIGDIGASLFGTVGILAALADRALTGRGAQIDVAMFDSQIALLENAMARYLNTGDRPSRLGSRHPLIAPFQAFPTKDEPIVICVDTEAQWQRFCEAISRGDLIKHPLFMDGNARAQHHAALEPELIAALAKRTRAEWQRAFEAADVPAGPINDIPAVVNDPQVIARDMVRRFGEGGFVNQPIKFSTYPAMPEQLAPRLGDHTQAVLAECGYSAEEIAAMKAAGAI